MSVGGICQVCEAASADDRCDRCGTIVCADHHDERRGVCVECAAELGFGDGSAGGGGDRDGDGGHPDVDRYQF